MMIITILIVGRNILKILKKIGNIINFKTIKIQMLFMHFVVVIPTLILFGMALYSSICSILEEANSKSYVQTLERSSKVLDQNLEYCRDISRSILSDSVLQEELKKSNNTSSSTQFFARESFANLNKAMEKYLTGFSGAQSIYIYDLQGKLFYLDYSSGNKDLSNAVDYQKIQKQRWYKEAIKYDGYEKFISFNVFSGNSNKFSCVKLLKDTKTQENIGLLIINFRKEFLNQIFPSNEKMDNVYALVDMQGNLFNTLVFQGDDSIEDELKKIIDDDDKQYAISTYKNEDTNWILFHLIDKKEIFEEAGIIKTVIRNGVIITIIMLVFVTWFLGIQITNSLYKLRDDILRVGNGERYLTSKFPNNEIGDIGREFNKMVNTQLALHEKMTELNLKTKEAELELLQSNINPHFLYNTLDSLYWMAVLQDADDIAELTKALTVVFKIALSKGEKMITIRDELEFVKNYLYIQNIRFECKIHVEITVDEHLLSYKIMKLLLQPFVENAVYHGLETKIDKGMINIRIYEKQNMIFFEIQDDGVGMDVNKDIEHGYAIKNSIERIHLMYGENANVEFFSERNKGTLVRGYFPRKD